MNKNIGFILAGIIAIVGLGYFAFSSNKADKSEMVKNDTVKKQMMDGENESIIAEKEDMTIDKKDDVMIKKNEVAIVDKDDTMTGSYVAYSADTIAMATTGDVVLFFHASWCPSCRALNSDIEKNVSAIPAGVTILKTDYDKEIELKKKYGVTTQHTLVQVDKDGNMIKKWSGGSELENLLAQIQ